MSILDKNGLKWTKFCHIRIFLAYRVWFSERGPSEQLPYKKLGRFIVAFGSYRPETFKLALNGRNFAIPWPKIRRIRIFPVYRVWFSQRGPYEQLPIKKLGRFIAVFGKYTSTSAQCYGLSVAANSNLEKMKIKNERNNKKLMNKNKIW